RRIAPEPHPDQGRGGLPRGRVDRGEGGGAAPVGHSGAGPRGSALARTRAPAPPGPATPAQALRPEAEEGRVPVEEVRDAGPVEAGRGAQPPPRPPAPAGAPRALESGLQEAGREDPARGARDRALVRRPPSRADRRRRVSLVAVRRRPRRRRSGPLPE